MEHNATSTIAHKMTLLALETQVVPGAVRIRDVQCADNNVTKTGGCSALLTPPHYIGTETLARILAL